MNGTSSESKGELPLLELPPEGRCSTDSASGCHHQSQSVSFSFLFKFKNQLLFDSLSDNQDCLETLKLTAEPAERREKTGFYQVGTLSRTVLVKFSGCSVPCEWQSLCLWLFTGICAYQTVLLHLLLSHHKHLTCF